MTYTMRVIFRDGTEEVFLYNMKEEPAEALPILSKRAPKAPDGSVPLSIQIEISD